MRTDVAIVGMGPAGLFTAFQLVRTAEQLNKNISIIMYDAGNELSNRFCPLRGEGQKCLNCNPCNITHGFGGSGTFSDCKLSLTPYVGGEIITKLGLSKTEELIKSVENLFDFFDDDSKLRKIIGGDSSNNDNIDTLAKESDILYTPCPTKHLGTDGTYKVMKNMYEYLKNSGKVKFKFNTNITDIGKITEGYILLDDDNDLLDTAEKVVLAVGRSGNKHICSLLKDFDDEINVLDSYLDIGVRVEIDSSITNKVTDALYDMKFSYFDKETKIPVRTFCTNPKGYVSEEHYSDGTVCANGHSYADKKSDRTNFAILARIKDKNIIQRVLNNRPHDVFVENFLDFAIDSQAVVKEDIDSDRQTLKSAKQGDVAKLLTQDIVTAITNFIYKLDDKLMPGLKSDVTYIYGPEIKYYSKQIKTDENFKLQDEDIYIIGDGSGTTRGIIQSACSGLHIADKIVYTI